MIESILENPRPVLSAQRSMARGEAVEAMKREGLEYEERMELLEDVTYPQPLHELLEVGYQAYAKSHPWVLDHALAPKSVARDLFERSMTFTEYVAFYGLARAEGLVLRYLADAYKALRQTVPETKRTEGAGGSDRLARRAGPADRLQPAGRVGEAQEPRSRRPSWSPRPTGGRPRSPATCGPSPCWSATRCSGGSSSSPGVGGGSSASSTGTAGWGADDWAAAMADYFVEHERCRSARTPADRRC